MTIHYPVAFETEASGAVSASVAGLLLYAAADSHKKADRAIRDVLSALLAAHPGTRSDAQVRVARFSDRQRSGVHIVGVAALLEAGRSAVKARALGVAAANLLSFVAQTNPPVPPEGVRSHGGRRLSGSNCDESLLTTPRGSRQRVIRRAVC